MLAGYAEEKIPSLEEELEVVKQNDLIFIFDLLAPIEGHPYQETFFDIFFDQIKQAGIDSKVWFLLDENELELVRVEGSRYLRHIRRGFQKSTDRGVTKGKQLPYCEHRLRSAG